MNRCSVLTAVLVVFCMAGQVSADRISGGGDRETAGKGRNNNNNKNKDNYKAGDGESVKKWKTESADDAKKAAKPICLYIYDPSDKKNVRAKLMEGPSFLGDSGVKSKLKSFECIKLAVTDDSKGWPASLLESAKSGAAVVLISSDFKNTQSFDNSTAKEGITVPALTATLDAVLKYEEQKKAAETKKPANAPAPVAAMK